MIKDDARLKVIKNNQYYQLYYIFFPFHYICLDSVLLLSHHTNPFSFVHLLSLHHNLSTFHIHSFVDYLFSCEYFVLLIFSLYLHRILHLFSPLYLLTHLDSTFSKRINNGFLSSPLWLWFMSEEINASATPPLWWSGGAVTSVTHYWCATDESAANPSGAQSGQSHEKQPGYLDRYHRADILRPAG